MIEAIALLQEFLNDPLLHLQLRNMDNKNALMLGTENGNTKACKFLLEKNLQCEHFNLITEKCEGCFNAFLLSAEQDHFDVCKLFLESVPDNKAFDLSKERNEEASTNLCYYLDLLGSSTLA